MEIVVVLISVIVSTVVIFAVRAMDRDSNSMDKVRRYADKRQADMEKFMTERFQSLRVAAVDLETKKDQALATINRLNAEMDGYQKEIGRAHV